MQKDALNQLAHLRNMGKDCGLVISATGTGKTYLGAFDVRNFRSKKMLFLAHREEILRKPKDSFRKVIGGTFDEYGLYTGNVKASRARYLFATVQTMRQNLNNFAPDEFDYILVD